MIHDAKYYLQVSFTKSLISASSSDYKQPFNILLGRIKVPHQQTPQTDPRPLPFSFGVTTSKLLALG